MAFKTRKHISNEKLRIKRKIQWIICGTFLCFSMIIAYFYDINNDGINDRRSLIEQDIDTPSGSDIGNVVEDEGVYPPNLFTDV